MAKTLNADALAGFDAGAALRDSVAGINALAQFDAGATAAAMKAFTQLDTAAMRPAIADALAGFDAGAALRDSVAGAMRNLLAVIDLPEVVPDELADSRQALAQVDDSPALGTRCTTVEAALAAAVAYAFVYLILVDFEVSKETVSPNPWDLVFSTLAGLPATLAWAVAIAIFSRLRPKD